MKWQSYGSNLTRKEILKMSPPTRKQLSKGARGYGDDPNNFDFLSPSNTNPFLDDGHSTVGYNARFDDAAGSSNYAGHGVDGAVDNEAFLSPSQARTDESYENIHQNLYRLIDGQADQPSGPMLTGGGPVSDNVPERDSGGGWGGSDRKGARFAPKTGPQGNMRKPR
jgi:hypothetical protein